MADFGDFNFDLGTDPFGGGGEGLIQMPVPTPETPSPGIGDAVGDIGKAIGGGAKSFGDVAKSALPFAQLGTAGLGIGLGIKGSQQQAEQTKIARGAEKRQEQIAGKAQEMAQPLSEFSKQELTQAGAGKIDP